MDTTDLEDESSLDKESEAIRIVSESQSHILSKAKHDIAELGAQEFIAKRIGSCFQVVKAYTQAFNLLEVPSKKEMERKISSKFRNAVIRDSYEDILNNEKEWNDMLYDLDKTLAKSGAILTKGDAGPLNTPLVKVNPQEEEELKNAGMKVLIVSFGQRTGALKWIEETGCDFDMVLDEERKVYSAFGLSRSVSKVWDIGSMVYYAEQVAAGRELPKPFENVPDDPIQMGGDFILDAEGVVVLSYPSQSASDRPSVDQLLQAVKDQRA